MFDHVSVSIPCIVKGKIEDEKWTEAVRKDGEFVKSLVKKLEKSCSRHLLDEKRQVEKH